MLHKLTAHHNPEKPEETAQASTKAATNRLHSSSRPEAARHSTKQDDLVALEHDRGATSRHLAGLTGALGYAQPTSKQNKASTDGGDPRFEPDGPVDESTKEVDGIPIKTQTYQNADDGEVTVSSYQRAGAQVEERSVKAADGSEYLETVSTGADGVKMVTKLETLPNGEQNEKTTITRPDGVVETTTTHRYQSNEPLEYLANIQAIHPPSEDPYPFGERECKIGLEGDSATSGRMTSYDPPPSPVEAGTGRGLAPTMVEETTRTVFDPNQTPQERVVAEGVSYTEKRGELNGISVPGDGETFDPESSGRYVTFSSMTEDGKTSYSQTNEIRIVGNNKDGSPFLVSRANTWDPRSGQLSTVTDLRGFKRDQTDDTFKVQIDGQSLSFTADANVSGKDPIQHLSDKGDDWTEDHGDADGWMGKGGNDPLDVRVTVTQSMNGKQEIIEMGDYADPTQDGKTVTRVQDQDGTTSWIYRKVSDDGNLTESQHVIEGSHYSSMDRTEFTAGGGYHYTHTARVGDKKLEETELTRLPIEGCEPYTYQTMAHSATYDPDTGHLQTAVDRNKSENPETGESETETTVTTSEGTEQITSTRTPGGDPVLEVVLNGKEVATVDSQGLVLIDGQPVPEPKSGYAAPASDEISVFQALSEYSPGLSKVLGAAGLLVGINDLDNGLSNGQWLKASAAAGGIVGALEDSVGLASRFTASGSKIGLLLENPALKAAGKFAGLLNIGVGVVEWAKGDKVEGGLDIGMGALGIWGLTNPYAFAASVGLTLGKLGYGWVKGKLEETDTEDIKIAP